MYYVVWCTVELETRNGQKNEYTVSSKVLETECGKPVMQSDLYFENTVIWKSRGKPYQVVILETHRKTCYHLSAFQFFIGTEPSKVNSHSDSEDESVLHQKKKRKIISDDELDEETFDEIGLLLKLFLLVINK